MSVLDPQRNRFYIGSENLLCRLEPKAQGPDVDSDLEQSVIDEIRVRVGTLLKTETVSLLLGAGASINCGGQLIGSVPIAVERAVLAEGIVGEGRPRIRRWLPLFYLAIRQCAREGAIPLTRDEILERRAALRGESPPAFPANFEQVLALLHRWRSALPKSGGRLRVDGSPPLDTKAEDLDTIIQQATRALARTCDLPATGKEGGLGTFKTLVRKLLTRPLNLKRVNVFTLNYDTLIEQAADAEGVVLLDGFVGTQRRVFRPESYEQDLYFPADTTEGRVHRFDRVLHLYKLHGSITWRATEPSIDNPYGLLSAPFDSHNREPLLIYPTPAKFGEVLGLPYSELFRRFAAALCRPQSVLFVIGYGFGDDHVNAIIRQALAIPSFTLVVVDPSPTSTFVKTLREQEDRRVWIAEGPSIGTLAGFVEHVLPDLRDEEIRRKVLATYRALSKNRAGDGDEGDGS